MRELFRWVCFIVGLVASTAGVLAGFFAYFFRVGYSAVTGELDDLYSDSGDACDDVA